jgi:hypothetical protein
MAELQDVLGVIAERAKVGEIRFVQLVLELTHKLRDKITVKMEVPEVGIEQYAVVIRQAARWKEEGQWGSG